MNYFFTSFTVAFRKKLLSPKTWLPVILLPLLILTCTIFLPQEERVAPVQVGIEYPEDGAEEFRAALEQRNGVIITFIETDEDTILKKVSTAQWDCGLLLPEDFSERLETLDLDELFTLYIGENSTAYPLVREAIAASIAEITAPAMAREYMEISGLYTEDRQALAEELLSRVLTEEDRIILTMETETGNPLEPISLAEKTWNNIYRGIVAIVLMIWMLFTAVDLGRWIDSPAAKRMRPLRNTTELLLPRAAASAILPLISGITAFCILPDRAASLPALICYLIALTALALLSARYRKIWTAFPIVMPIIPVLCLLATPIIVDFSMFFPRLAPLQACIPVTMLLRGCSGSAMQMVYLLLIAAASVGLSLIADAAESREIRKKA